MHNHDYVCIVILLFINVYIRIIYCIVFPVICSLSVLVVSYTYNVRRTTVVTLSMAVHLSLRIL